MTRGKWIVAAAALLAVLAGGWWLASPWLTLRGMKAAAEAGDAEAFAAYVDFAALREDMRAEATARAAAEARARGGPAAEMGARVAAGLVGHVVDAIVTPEGIRLAFVAGAAHRAAGEPLREVFDVGDDPDVTRRGIDEFLLHRAGSPDSGLVFRRHGLGWRLSGVELPARAMLSPSR